MKVFHFAGVRLRDFTPLPAAGDELPARDALLCKSGWHGSVRALDALNYAPGCNVAVRELHGEILTDADKACASHCRMITGYVDASAVLVEYAAWCAGRAAAEAAIAERTASWADAADARAAAAEAAQYAEWSATHAERAAEGAAAHNARAYASAAEHAARSASKAALYGRRAAAEGAAVPAWLARTGWSVYNAAYKAAYNAEEREQEAWLRPRLLALLGQEDEG